MKVNPNLAFLRKKHLQDRIMVLQGGTRSGKTYSALQFLIELCYRYKNAGMVITIARQQLNVLRGSGMRDFFDILQGKMDPAFNVYRESNHSKSNNEYTLRGNLIEFIGLDEELKVRGRKRDILYLNEGNEASFESWRQLMFRTKAFAVVDYNPSMQDHWIYDHVLTRNDAELLITTYKDNPHLPAEQVKEIERLETEDENYWQIFGLGNRGKNTGSVYTRWKVAPPELDYSGWSYCYGMDFGFNAKTALMKIYYRGNQVVWQEVIYKSMLTTPEMIALMKDAGVSRHHTIYADSSDKRAITEIGQAGFRITQAVKDVLPGIRFVNSCELYVAQDSYETLKEIKNHKWKVDRNGTILDEPVKFQDHLMDAGRYGTFSELKGKTRPAKFPKARAHDD